MAHSCRECNMSFETAESLANHKTNFCIDSDWVDPEVMKRQLANEEAGIGSNTTRELSFDEVKSYLKRRATGEETGIKLPYIVTVCLDTNEVLSIRRNFA